MITKYLSKNFYKSLFVVIFIFILDRISKIVEKINSFEETIKNLSDSDFPKKTLEFKEGKPVSIEITKKGKKASFYTLPLHFNKKD